jgi:hypothetical protein
MTARYEPVQPPRFTVETVDGSEQINIPPQRSVFIGLFLAVWLTGWTIGGVAAFVAFLKTQQPFLALWLCGWVAGEAFVALTLLWMFTGGESVRLIGKDLEIGAHVLGWDRRKVYQGSQIRNLSSSAPANFYNGRWQGRLPILFANTSGSFKFDYGGRTIYVGPGLDEAEGRMIVERLRARLPASATT